MPAAQVSDPHRAGVRTPASPAGAVGPGGGGGLACWFQVGRKQRRECSSDAWESWAVSSRLNTKMR